MKTQFILFFLGLILALSASNSSAEVFEEGSNTVESMALAGIGPATGIDCGKYTITLTGGPNSDILAGVMTNDNAEAVNDKLSNDSYNSPDEAVSDIRSRILSGSECTFAEFGSSETCSKVVLLDTSETYYAGIGNKGNFDQDFSYSIESCTESEKAAVTAASSTSKLSVLAGLFSATFVALTLA
jgi:hypothetical protein